MKKINFLLAGIFAWTMTSCGDEDPNINVYPDEQILVAPVLNTPSSSDFVVVQTTDNVTGNETEVATTLSWEAAQGAYNGVIQYYIQIAPAGSNFVDAVRIFNDGTTQLTKDITYGDLNLAMKRLSNNLIANNSGEILFGQANEIDVRVMAVTQLTQNTAFSDVKTINVTPYDTLEVPTPQLFLVGGVQSHYGLSSWDNTTAMPMRYIGDGTTMKFEAYVKVGTDEGFKFIGELGSWDNGNYGTIGGAQDGNLENSGGSGDIKVAQETGSGLYYVQVDLDAMTYKYIKMEWGIIGHATANGWDAETPMTYDFATNKYSLSTSLSDGEIKFRSGNTGTYINNDAWSFNVGNSNPTVTYDMSAPNFPITAGSYNLSIEVHFDGTVTVNGL